MLEASGRVLEHTHRLIEEVELALPRGERAHVQALAVQQILDALAAPPRGDAGPGWIRVGWRVPPAICTRPRCGCRARECCARTVGWDVLVPITSRARGEVEVTYQGDQRTDTFAAQVTSGDAALDRIRFKEPITGGQARLGTGIITLGYKGDTDTRAEEVRLRAASQRADLDVEEISLLGDGPSANGSVTGRAEGIVRLRFSYLDATGAPQVHLARATIQDDGDWELENDAAPPQLARCGGYLSILFTGYFERRIRGEMLAYELNAGQTRRP